MQVTWIMAQLAIPEIGALNCRAGDMAPCLMPRRGLLRPTRYKHGGKLMEDSGSHFLSLLLQPAYVLQIFPPCEFSESHLSRLAPDLLASISNISPHLMIVIASV